MIVTWRRLTPKYFICVGVIFLVTSRCVVTNASSLSHAHTYPMGSDTLPEEATPLPKFLSRGHSYRVVIKKTILLPCEVENLGTFVLLWRRGSAVLTAGNLMVTRDRRFRLVDGYNLQLNDVRPQDAGDYVCQISDQDNRDQVHTVEILVPPTIKTIPPNGQVTARKGSSVTLECKSSGNPVPNIHWTRKNPTQHNGQQLSDGSTIVLDRLERQHAGIYQCTASNGVDDPVTRDIQVTVLSPPEITVGKPWVHAGEGHEAKLVCNVQGEANPEIMWYQDSFPVSISDRINVESHGERHSLTIRHIQTSDFGNYSCVADNSLGRAKKYIELSGRPGPAEFHSPLYSHSKNSFNLTWSIESYPHLEEVRLMFRKLMMNDTYQHPGRWHEIYLQSRQTSAGSMKHFMYYNIRGLQQSSVYEAIVQAKNRFGWNVVSDIYQFYTRGAEPVVKDMEVKASSISSGGSSVFLPNFSKCLIATLLL